MDFAEGFLVNKRNRSPQSVLCVDDDQDIREILQEIISHFGHTGITATDGLDALEKLTENHFDIIITDLKMPHIDGLELIKRIKAEFTDVDVIAVTAHHIDYEYTQVIEAGACDFISKPFNVNELEAKINRIIRERKLLTQLKRLSTSDGLTGLYNRRYFDENLRREAIRALRQNYSMYLLFVDLDNLKMYNDKYGHQQGDSLLREFARIVMGNIRKDVDSAYRYGGDEFAVVLPHANRQEAQMVANRFLTEYKSMNFDRTSLSIGLGELEASRQTLEEDLRTLVGKADKALYCAKSNNGNRVCH